MYVKNYLTSNLRVGLDSCSDDFATIWVETDNKQDKDFLLCCVYRHPSSNVDNLTFHFQNLLSKISSNKLVFIMGDFNINILDYASHTPIGDLVNNIFSYSLLPCNHHPTRVIEYSASVIDNIYTYATNATITSGNILMQITGQFPQFFILKNAPINHNKLESFKYDYTTFNENEFHDDFNQIDFAYLENNDIDVNKKFDRFLKDLTSLTNKPAPIKKRSRKEMKLQDKPWINSKMQKMMRIRDRILQKLKKQQTDDNLKRYKKFRNRVSNELKESKGRYYHNYFSTNSNNIKRLWLGIVFQMN